MLALINCKHISLANNLYFIGRLLLIIGFTQNCSKKQSKNSFGTALVLKEGFDLFQLKINKKRLQNKSSVSSAYLRFTVANFQSCPMLHKFLVKLGTTNNLGIRPSIAVKLKCILLGKWAWITFQSWNSGMFYFLNEVILKTLGYTSGWSYSIRSSSTVAQRSYCRGERGFVYTEISPVKK